MIFSIFIIFILYLTPNDPETISGDCAKPPTTRILENILFFIFEFLQVHCTEG